MSTRSKVMQKVAKTIVECAKLQNETDEMKRRARRRKLPMALPREQY
jgi:hypothetical protein